MRVTCAAAQAVVHEGVLVEAGFVVWACDEIALALLHPRVVEERLRLKLPGAEGVPGAIKELACVPGGEQRPDKTHDDDRGADQRHREIRRSGARVVQQRSAFVVCAHGGSAVRAFDATRGSCEWTLGTSAGVLCCCVYVRARF